MIILGSIALDNWTIGQLDSNLFFHRIEINKGIINVKL